MSYKDSLNSSTMISKVSDIPGWGGFELRMVLVHWMRVKLEADCPVCPAEIQLFSLALQRSRRVVILLGGTLLVSFTGVFIFQVDCSDGWEFELLAHSSKLEASIPSEHSASR